MGRTVTYFFILVIADTITNNHIIHIRGALWVSHGAGCTSGRGSGHAARTCSIGKQRLSVGKTVPAPYTVRKGGTLTGVWVCGSKPYAPFVKRGYFLFRRSGCRFLTRV